MGIIILTNLMLISCVEDYNPKIERYENLLIVDGALSNLQGPYTVKLYRSYGFNEKNGATVSGANVKIIDNNGNAFDFAESAIGQYTNVDKNFKGIPGNSYKLIVELENGNVYESPYEMMGNPVEIEDVYYVFEPKTIEGILGVQIYADTRDPLNEAQYFIWKYDETWEFNVPFNFQGSLEKEICYKYNTSNELIIGSASDKTTSVITRQPITYIDYNTDKLYRRYSLLLEQHVISEKLYNYLKSLKELNDNMGTLYDVSPYSLTGNISNISNPEEVVLGYFRVTAASTKRMFINNDDNLPHRFEVHYDFWECKNRVYTLGDPQIEKDIQQLWAPFDTTMIIIYIDLVDSFDLDTTYFIYLASGSGCFDCTKSGSLKVPEYWEDVPYVKE